MICGGNMEEIWKDIKNYEVLYQVSNLGKIYSKKNKKILKNNIRNTYYIIQLTKDKKRKSFQVHRLVAEAFIPNPQNKPIVNHINYNRLDNRVNNLEWCSQKENVNHSICNMKHKKSITHSNTNEKYITYRKDTNKYRLTIDKKEYQCKTLDEAIKKRDEILNEKI